MPAALVQAQDADLGQYDELDTVLVIGEQPGPGLWKVSQGDHVLWILATYGPLPRGMSWQSQQVEARIRESAEVLYPASVDLSLGIGMLRGLTLLPAAFKAARLPDGATLADVLEPEVHAKWRSLREKYKGDDVEKLRPSIALASLRADALRSNGLRNGPSVTRIVDATARKHKVRVHRLPAIKRAVKVENPRGMLKTARNFALPDLACFVQGLDQLEPDMVRMKELANAWARGDIDLLSRLNRVRALRDVCAYSLLAAFDEDDSADAARASKLLANIEWHAEQAAVQAQRDWLAAARAALAKNASTFAVLPVADVLREGGVLMQLRELGYAVEEPLR